MRIKALAAAIIAATGLAIIPSITTAAGSESRVFQLLNDERTRRGAKALTWNSRAASVARTHSQDMASDGELRHNSRLPSQMSGWSRLGENVGEGSSVELVHDAFMNSASHRANILDRGFTQAGIGVVTDADGVLWITQVFFTPEYTQQSTVTRRVAPKEKPVVRTVQRARRSPVRPQVRRSTPAVERPRKPEPEARAPLGTHMHPVGTAMPFGG